MKFIFAVLALIVSAMTQAETSPQFAVSATCLDRSSAETCMRRLRMQLKIVPDASYALDIVNVYVIATRGETEWTLSASGFEEYQGGPVQPFYTGVLDSRPLELLGEGADVFGLAGARFTVGYGVATNPNGSWNDMIRRKMLATDAYTLSWSVHLIHEVTVNYRSVGGASGTVTPRGPIFVQAGSGLCVDIAPAYGSGSFTVLTTSQYSNSWFLANAIPWQGNMAVERNSSVRCITNIFQSNFVLEVEFRPASSSVQTEVQLPAVTSATLPSRTFSVAVRTTREDGVVWGGKVIPEGTHMIGENQNICLLILPPPPEIHFSVAVFPSTGTFEWKNNGICLVGINKNTDINVFFFKPKQPTAPVISSDNNNNNNNNNNGNDDNGEPPNLPVPF